MKGDSAEDIKDLARPQAGKKADEGSDPIKTQAQRLFEFEVTPPHHLLSPCPVMMMLMLMMMMMMNNY